MKLYDKFLYYHIQSSTPTCVQHSIEIQSHRSSSNQPLLPDAINSPQNTHA